MDGGGGGDREKEEEKAMQCPEGYGTPILGTNANAYILMKGLNSRFKSRDTFFSRIMHLSSAFPRVFVI